MWQQGKSEDEFEDGYDSDLMGDEEDRSRLNAMDELDREMILADRAEARDAAMERKRAEQALRQQQEQQQRAAEKVAIISLCSASGRVLLAPCPAAMSSIDHTGDRRTIEETHKLRRCPPS